MWGEIGKAVLGAIPDLVVKIFDNSRKKKQHEAAIRMYFLISLAAIFVILSLIFPSTIRFMHDAFFYVFIHVYHFALYIISGSYHVLKWSCVSLWHFALYVVSGFYHALRWLCIASWHVICWPFEAVKHMVWG